jgi:acetyltransferase
MDHMIEEPEVGTLVVASAGAGNQPEHVIELRDRTDKNVAFFFTASRNDKALEKLKSANIPIFYSPEKLARGLKFLVDYHAWRDERTARGASQAEPITPQQRAALEKARAAGRATLSESESKQLVAAWGVPVAREIAAQSAGGAVEAARNLGLPVVLKVDSPDILHKTEAGGVRLGLADDAAVRAAYEEIVANAKRYAPDATIAGVSVQEMVEGGVETIVGIKYDAQLGPMLVFGSGGVMVEVFGDVATRHCPISRSEALQMIDEVKGAKLLRGFRGKPAADIDALADVLVRVSHMAVRLEGELAELDINPLMVLPEGRGVKAADALAVLRENAD